MIRHYPGWNEEILAWLDQHPEVENFVIIDDVDQEQMEGMEEHFFQTKFEEGLLREQSLKIIDHLTRNWLAQQQTNSSGAVSNLSQPDFPQISNRLSFYLNTNDKSIVKSGKIPTLTSSLGE